MKKVIVIVVAVILIGVAGFEVYNHFTNDDGNSRVSNDTAEKDTRNRYLTIINDTGQIINEVHITVGDGTEIEHGYQENPDETSFSVKIPKAYEEYETFTITFVDRYELKYEKTIEAVKAEGRTEVTITEDDYVKQEGDWKRKMDMFFNE